MVGFIEEKDIKKVRHIKGQHGVMIAHNFCNVEVRV